MATTVNKTPGKVPNKAPGKQNTKVYNKSGFLSKLPAPVIALICGIICILLILGLGIGIKKFRDYRLAKNARNTLNEMAEGDEDNLYGNLTEEDVDAIAAALTDTLGARRLADASEEELKELADAIQPMVLGSSRSLSKDDVTKIVQGLLEKMREEEKLANTDTQQLIKELDGRIRTLEKENQTLKEAINGTKGSTGATGSQGPTGATGSMGPAGKDGRDGVNGKDGATGKDGVAGKNGRDGVDGENGDDGLITYISFAKDANGEGASEHPFAEARYIAVIRTDSENYPPVSSFQGHYEEWRDYYITVNGSTLTIYD